MRWTVLSVGRRRPPFADDIEHYRGLLRRYAAVERRIPERAFVSLLAVDGRPLDSVSLSRFLEERRMSGLDLCFVIGGAYGLELPDADHRLSLGPLTMPHQLARVVLLEQLFRAHKILKNEPYHH